MTNQEVFGVCWWIEKTLSGRFILIESEINVGNTKINELTDKQIQECDIMIFNTIEEASKERLKRMLVEWSNKTNTHAR